jgi:hypothetical protein
VGRGVGVAGTGVGDGVGLGVAVGDGVGLGVAVGDGVGLAVGLAVGVGVAPMPARSPNPWVDAPAAAIEPKARTAAAPPITARPGRRPRRAGRLTPRQATSGSMTRRVRTNEASDAGRGIPPAGARRDAHSR